MKILEVNNLKKSFNDNEVLKDINLFVNEGEVVSIIGPSGSGKTTLLRIIMGELSPDDGQVTISKDKTVGYLPQNALLASDNSIYDELIIQHFMPHFKY